MAEAGRNLYDDGEALALYDQYVLATRGYDPGSQDWERQHKSNSASWAGHCQAWAAASILSREPPAGGVNRAGIHFGQDALEGLVTSMYEVPEVAGFWGQRYDGPQSGQSAYDDLNPAWMDFLLRYYVTDHGSSFIMDTDPGAPVWNFPVAGYEQQKTQNADGSVRVKTDVWFRSPSAGVSGYDANSFFKKTYEYDLWNTADGKSSTGRWVSADHPDFAWAPGKGQASDGHGNLRNPRLDPKIVEEILGYPP
jgi:hypothetical protein